MRRNWQRFATRPPSGADWLNEIKFDGYRVLCRIENGKPSLITRNRLFWTRRFREIAAGVSKLPIKSGWLDGEIVAFRPDGISDFSLLQASLRKKQSHLLTYCVFDVPHLDGQDLRKTPLVERKAMRRRALKGRINGRLQYVDHVEGQGPEFFEHCRRMGLEGAVSKKADSPYRSGRSNAWLKVKCRHRGEFIIAGYAESSSRRGAIQGLVLASYGPDGTLRYDGRVGSGLSARIEAELLHPRLNPSVGRFFSCA